MQLEQPKIVVEVIQVFLQCSINREPVKYWQDLYHGHPLVVLHYNQQQLTPQ